MAVPLLDAIRQDKPHNEARRAAEANFAAILGRTAVHTGSFVTAEDIKASNFQYVREIDQMSFDTPPPISANLDGTYSRPSLKSPRKSEPVWVDDLQPATSRSLPGHLPWQGCATSIKQKRNSSCVAIAR